MIKKRKSSKSSKKFSMIFCIGLLTLFSSIACGYTTYHYNEIKYWDKLIYPGVTIEGLNLSEKTKEQAQSLIKEKYLGEISKRKINIKVEDKVFNLEYAKIDPKYNIEETVNKAFSYGKDSNFFTKYTMIKNAKSKNFNLKLAYNDKPLKELIDNVEKEVEADPVDATIDLSKGGFTIVPEQDGKKLEKEKLEKEVFNRLNGSASESLEFNGALIKTPPHIKGDMIKDINALIGSYGTQYGGISSYERANNIQIATKSINGKILMPGDVFSFNDVVGERTAEKGYEAAGVIVGNKLESGLGGGVCQVSSTLFNAANRAGMESIERSHHTMPVHYVPPGMDATVDFGNIDFKFKNIYEYPVYIQAYTSGGSVRFNLYSSSKVK